LAENVSCEEDQALLKRIARDFDEAADELERKRR
jgi:cell division protein ZapA (FtsZ GTPase activity inhibitor)